MYANKSVCTLEQRFWYNEYDDDDAPSRFQTWRFCPFYLKENPIDH